MLRKSCTFDDLESLETCARAQHPVIYLIRTLQVEQQVSLKVVAYVV